MPFEDNFDVVDAESMALLNHLRRRRVSYPVMLNILVNGLLHMLAVGCEDASHLEREIESVAKIMKGMAHTAMNEVRANPRGSRKRIQLVVTDLDDDPKVN
jgi:hypothetical protein